MACRPYLLLGILLLCASPLQASAGGGGLIVWVQDAEGGPLANVPVHLTHETGLVPGQTLRTAADGRVWFAVLPARAGYVVEASFADGRTHHAQVQIPLGQTASVVLKWTSRAEVADAPPDQLPYPGRLFPRLLALTPGAGDPTRDLRSGGHGSRGRDLAIVADGIRLDRDPLTTKFTSYLNSDTIDQLVVDLAGTGVEYGGAQGGFATIVQRDGSNAFQGALGILYGTSDLDGSGAHAAAIAEPDFQSIDTTLQLSGPLLRDRLWFRLAWEHVDREDPIDVLRDIAVQPTRRDVQSHRLTLQASPRNRLAFQYQSDPLEIGLFGIDSVVRPEAAQRLDTETETASVLWTAPYSPNLLVQTSVMLQRREGRLGPAIPGVPNEYCVGAIATLEDGFCVPPGRETSGSHYLSVTSDSHRLALVSRATWDAGRFGGAAHRVNFGLELASEKYDGGHEQRPILGVAGFDDALFFERLAATVAVPSRTDAPVDQREWSVYFEDRIKPAANLAITVGVRVDREELDATGMSDLDPAGELAHYVEAIEEGQQLPEAFRSAFTAFEGLEGAIGDLADLLQVPVESILISLSNVLRQSGFHEQQRKLQDLNLTNTNASYSFSLSWDPWRDARTEVGFSGRRYHDRLTPVHPLIGNRPATTVLRNPSPNGPDLISTFSVRSVDRNLETPYQNEWRVFASRELWPETSLRAEYIRRDYRNQLQEVDINHLAGDFGRCKVASALQTENLLVSPGSGFDITDPYTGEVYADTDPGDGDGRLDDCVGLVEWVQSPYNPYVMVSLQRPDGFDDEYVQNPLWNEVRRTGNFNRSDYEAGVLEFIRRRHRGWGLTASYVWSRHRGLAENLEPFQRVEPADLDDVAGDQSNHQEHEVRVAGSAKLPRGFRFGAILTWGSGLPYSRVERHTLPETLPPLFDFIGNTGAARSVLRYPTGERNTLRNAAQWLVDLRLAKEFDLGRGVQGQLSLDVFNALDDDPFKIYNPDLQIGLEVDGVQRVRRDFGRRWQVGARLEF